MYEIARRATSSAAQIERLSLFPKYNATLARRFDRAARKTGKGTRAGEM